MNYYLPPAGIADFSKSNRAEELSQKWHDTTSHLLGYIMGQKTINGKKSTRVSPLFYDQLADQSGIPDSAPTKIPWNAFPLRLEKWFNPGTSLEVRNQMFRIAEQLINNTQYIKVGINKYKPIDTPFRIQDEYCEWHVVSGDKPGSIKRIYFTCEPPEYWNFLAENDKTLLLDLYRELLHNPDIQESDLFWQQDIYKLNEGGKTELVAKANQYNPNNKWNTTDGAIHLTHPANSLYAEMFLASDSTFGWPVTQDATGKIDVNKLMCCAGVGGINRSSDPLILAGVYNYAKENYSVALANPIGLYMMPFQLDLIDPEGNQIGDVARKVLRCSPDKSKWLRVELSLPEDAGYTLDQCLLSGEPLLFGGQVAKQITMAIFGVAKKIPGKVKKEIAQCPSFCCDHPDHPLFQGTFRVQQGVTCNSLTNENWKEEAYDIPQTGNQNFEITFKGFNEGMNTLQLEAVEQELMDADLKVLDEINGREEPASVPNFIKSAKGRGVLPIDNTAPKLF